MPQAEIEHELRTSGSGFAQGKQRIMELFQTQSDRNLRAKALAKEYGIGGHSHSYLDGRSGFITYNSSGMEFSLHSTREPFKLKWAAIEQYIDLMIQSGRYLTDEEREQRTAAQEATTYKVGDEVVVDLSTRTIEGTIGYVGETDVRIDTSAHGHSWDNEVINKQQFEDALRQEEPDEPELSDEELDELPVSVVIDGKVQTFPDAAALDEALDTESVPEPAGNFRITDDHLGEGGPKQKYARNVEAIRTLFRLEQEHRAATAEEQQVLSQYVGWGGLPDVFDPDKDSWATEYAERKDCFQRMNMPLPVPAP